VKIHKARLKALEVVPIAGECSGPIVHNMDSSSVDLQLEDQCFFLKSKSSERVAVLNEATSKILQGVSTLEKCYFKAYLAGEDSDGFIQDTSQTYKKLYISVDIVLYGPKETRDVVGKLLSTARTYLQHPCYQEAGSSYDNPHFLKFEQESPPVDPSLNSAPPITRAQVDSEVLTNVAIQAKEGSAHFQVGHKVAKVFNSLTRSKNLKRIEADTRIRTPLLP
jgi:SWI/SNF-related matrix-associated actin-dependent regulator of chromatin subfamily A3